MCRSRNAFFRNTEFQGGVDFAETTFNGVAEFKALSFTGSHTYKYGMATYTGFGEFLS